MTSTKEILKTIRTTLASQPSERASLALALIKSLYAQSEKGGLPIPTHGTRTLHLASAFIRGVPYRTLESTARPMKFGIGWWEGQCTLQAISIIANLCEDRPSHRTEKEIQQWMEIPEVAERRVARELIQKRRKLARATAKMDRERFFNLSTQRESQAKFAQL